MPHQEMLGRGSPDNVQRTADDSGPFTPTGFLSMRKDKSLVRPARQDHRSVLELCINETDMHVRAYEDCTVRR